MRILSLAVVLGVAVALSGCATHYFVDPVAAPGQEVRYDQGTPTTFSDREHGAVQITPFGIDEQDGRIVFGVAAYNKGPAPSNFGVENIFLAGSNGGPLKVFTGDELVREARSRATAASIAAVLIGVAAAVSANENATRTTRGTFFTRRGPVGFVSRSYDPGAAAFGTIVAGVGTGLALGSIRNSLDRTIAGISNEVLETTTIDPDRTYGGIVVGDRPRAPVAPQEVMVTVRFNGDEHQFTYMIARAQ